MVQEYPRPQLRRDRFCMLDGEWRMNGMPVKVPFPPGSPASGFEGPVPEQMTYIRQFTVPDTWKDCRVLLHFGAADQTAEVYINDEFCGKHEGGCLPFTFDITDRLIPGENSLRAEIRDSLSVQYPYGKQSKKPGGMWYTPVSGIWKSVWMEPVPKHYIESICLTPDCKGVRIELYDEDGRAVTDYNVRVLPGSERENTVRDSTDSEWKENCAQQTENLHTGQESKMEAGFPVHCVSGSFYLEIPFPHCWTPEDPFLYRLELEAFSGTDRVETYFALRTVETGVRDGIPGIFLNGRRIFLHGVLDQGYFPEGIYTSSDPEAYARDIMRMKELGFNALRKHIKVEPEAFYYACDRLGMLVIQDMVNSGPYHYLRETVLPNLGFVHRNDRLPGPTFNAVFEKQPGREYEEEEINTDIARMRFFIRHMKDTILHLYSHPCIIAWTLFNEGWGQFESDRLYELAKELDPSRPVDSTSGWFAQKSSDFDSRHIYFVNRRLVPKKAYPRPVFLTECGGYGLRIEGHVYARNKPFGYGNCKNDVELTGRILALYEKMILPAIPEGLCGCVYTQLSDVEEEINGLYTYDREICKVLPDRMLILRERIDKMVSRSGSSCGF